MVVTSQVLMVLSFVMAVAQMIYQLVSAKKPAAPDNSAAEARKGYEMVVDGKPDNLPVVYGRAKVGGVRTFHATSSEFLMPETTSANKVWATGISKDVAQEVVIDISLMFWDEEAGVLRPGEYLRNSDGTMVYDSENNPIVVAKSETMISKNSTQLDQDYKVGHRNQFLFFQQAFCVGEIEEVVDVIMDESKYLDDPGLGTYGWVPLGNSYTADQAPEKHKWLKPEFPRSALRIDLHYREGKDPTGVTDIGFGVSDNVLTKNFPETINSRFGGLSYASACFRLDRDDPQFNGVPNLQFLVKGRRIKTITSSYTLSTENIYSNNPAWCLLDYLTSKEYGAKVDFETEIDAKSFYDAANVCDAIVQRDVAVGGKIWKPTDKSFAVAKRNLPLYECNILVDTKKSVRDNIELILGTMADARLVWAGGRYKLSLQYPNVKTVNGEFVVANSSNSHITEAVTLTDDDLVLDQDVEITWPSASERLNHCTVKFHNEAEDFKEDSASWPPKVTSTALRGIGGTKYPAADYSWNEESEGGRFLNNYGVWSGTYESTELQYLFIVRKEDVLAGGGNNFTLEYTADSQISIEILYSESTTVKVPLATYSDKTKVKKVTGLNFGSTQTDMYYVIKINASNVDGYSGNSSAKNDKGVAAKISMGTSRVLWTTRDFAYTSVTNEVLNKALYEGYKAVDANLELEMEIFADGITDKYHALARAEELVRTSRSAYTIKFKYLLKDVYLEPGDFVKLNSETLQILTDGNSSNYFRVNSVKIGEDSTCEITAQHFNYDQLAWSTKNNEWTTPPNYNPQQKAGPTGIKFSHSTNITADSSGTLEWDPVNSAKVKYYIISMYIAEGEKDIYLQNYNTNIIPIFNQIGQSTDTIFELPIIAADNVLFSIKAIFEDGSSSLPSYSSENEFTYLRIASYTFEGLDISVANSIMTWTASSLSRDGNLQYQLAGGTATWNGFDNLYLYLDIKVAPNVIKSTSNVADLLNQKEIAVYKGGSNLTTLLDNVEAPVKLNVNSLQKIETVDGVPTYIFEGSDVLLQWECDPKTLKNPSKFKGYQIIFSKMDNTVVLTRDLKPSGVKTKFGSYNFTIEANIDKFLTATRQFKVKIYSTTSSGGTSISPLAAIITNKVPPKLTLESEISYKSVFLKAADTSELDITGYIFKRYASETALTPLDTVVSKNNYLYYKVVPSTPFWYTVTAKDDFGEGQESAKVKITASGEIAHVVTLTSNKNYIIYKADGSKKTANENITFTARLNEGAISDYYFKFIVNGSPQVTNIANSALTYTPSATYAAFGEYETNYFNVVVELYKAEDHTVLLASDVLRVYALKMGSGVIQPILSNMYQSLPVGIDGTVDMSNSGANLQVFYEDSPMTYLEDLGILTSGPNNSFTCYAVYAENILPDPPDVLKSIDGKSAYTDQYKSFSQRYGKATIQFNLAIKNYFGVVSYQAVTQTLFKQFASDEKADIQNAINTAISVISNNGNPLQTPTFNAPPIIYSNPANTSTSTEIWKLTKDNGKFDGTVRWSYGGEISSITGFGFCYIISEKDSQEDLTIEGVIANENFKTFTATTTSYTIKDLGTDKYTCAYIFAYRNIAASTYDLIAENERHRNQTSYWAVSYIARSHPNGELSQPLDRLAINADLKYGDKLIPASVVADIAEDYDADNNSLDTPILTQASDFDISYENPHPDGTIDIIFKFSYAGDLDEIDGFAIYEGLWSNGNTVVPAWTPAQIYDSAAAHYITKEDFDGIASDFYIKILNAQAIMFRTFAIVPYRIVSSKTIAAQYKTNVTTLNNPLLPASACLSVKNGKSVCLGPVTKTTGQGGLWNSSGTLWQAMTKAVFDGYVQTTAGLLSVSKQIYDFNITNTGYVADVTTPIAPITTTSMALEGATTPDKVDVICNWTYDANDIDGVDGFIVTLYTIAKTGTDSIVTTLPKIDSAFTGSWVSTSITERTYRFTDLPTANYYNFIVFPYRILSDTTYALPANATKRSTLSSGGIYRYSYPFLYPAYIAGSPTNQKYSRANTQGVVEPPSRKRGDYWLNTSNTTINSAAPFRIAIYNGTSWNTLTADEIALKEKANYAALLYESATEPFNEIGYLWKNTNSKAVSGVDSLETVTWEAVSGLWVPYGKGRTLNMTVGSQALRASTYPLEGNYFLTDGTGTRTLYLARDGAWRAKVDLASTEYGTTLPATTTNILNFLVFTAPKANTTTTAIPKFYKRLNNSAAWGTAVNLTDKKRIDSPTKPTPV